MLVIYNYEFFLIFLFYYNNFHPVKGPVNFKKVDNFIYATSIKIYFIISSNQKSTNMKKLLFITLTFLSNIIYSQEWVTPVINGYGKIKYTKDVAVQPDNNLVYKIVYKITTGETREGINKGLNGIAHAINMLGCADIKSDAVNIVATIQGAATNIILDDVTYEEKYGEKNPNTKIIELLTNYGVKLFVCSQATAYKNIKETQINKNITQALSGSSVLLNYQLNGYVLMQ